MHEWPIDRELDAKLRRLVLDEVAAANPRQIALRARPQRRSALVGPGLAALAAFLIIATLVWRGQGLPVAGGPNETPTATPSETPSETAPTATPSSTPAPSETPTPGVQTLTPGLTPGPTADPALTASKIFGCSWDGGFAVELADGRVLVAGGGCQPPAIFDPNTRTFRATGSMNSNRINGTATLLKDGRVLITGGQDPATSANLTTDEIYDPKTGRFTPIGPVTPQSGTAAVLLQDGRVLIVESGTDSTLSGFAQIFDPASGTFTATGPLAGGSDFRSAVLLNDGKVLVVDASGSRPVGTQVYDPATNSFRATRGQIDGGFLTTRLPDGRAMIISGPTLVEAYDPATDTFRRLASPSHLSDVMACATLSDGRILVVGPADDAPGAPAGWRSTDGLLFDARPTAGRRAPVGNSTAPYVLAGLVYDPAHDKWTYLGDLPLERLFIVGVAPLPNGGAMVIGDQPGGGNGVEVELFDPKTGMFILNR